MPVKKIKFKNQGSFAARLGDDLVKNRTLYVMLLPVVIFYIIFMYFPMYGVLMAFQQYDPASGILGSKWVGMQNFKDFFGGMYCFRTIRNTLVISLTNILFGFPAPIILALLINEVTSKKLARTVQTATYLPHFISLVVICGMIKVFTNTGGVVSNIVKMFTGYDRSLLSDPAWFVPVYVVSGIWQEIGWGSIIYLSALSGIDTQLYEACQIDGGNRLHQTWYVTLPGIVPTIVIMFIMRMGSVLNVGYEKIILLYNQSTFETADVISSYVYRKGLQELNWSYGTAVGLFNSVVNIILLVATNKISKRVSGTSLW